MGLFDTADIVEKEVFIPQEFRSHKCEVESDMCTECNVSMKKYFIFFRKGNIKSKFCKKCTNKKMDMDFIPCKSCFEKRNGANRRICKVCFMNKDKYVGEIEASKLVHIAVSFLQSNREGDRGKIISYVKIDGLTRYRISDLKKYKRNSDLQIITEVK